MTKRWELSEEDFQRFLTWVEPNPEVAGHRYEEFRRGLIIIFTSRGCHIPEELADETFNRVSRRLPHIIDNYQGHPAAYIHKVAHHLFLEYAAQQVKTTPFPDDYDPPAMPSTENKELEDRCLEECLNKLTPNNRIMVLEYYRGAKQSRIEQRRKLAEAMSLTLNGLRLRAMRIRSQLEECLKDCLAE